MPGKRGEVWNGAAALLAGLLLRAFFVWHHPRFVGDTLVYADLARNLVTHGVYGLTENGAARATLIRLPGYPLFLALCSMVFGTGNFLAVVWVQVVVDLLGCWLLGRTARRVFGDHVGLVCLWLAALCPFTANYAAAALTETLSIFCVALALWAFAGWLSASRGGDRALGWAAGLGAAWAGAVLLRPDGVLLAAAFAPPMLWAARRRRPVQTRLGALTGPFLALSILGACLGVWGLRNWRIFHVVQPLAPKYANDPGEPAPLGFARWYRTWGTGLGDTARVYWEYDGSVLNLDDLPPWAFDSLFQRQETAEIYDRYNAESSSTPEVEAAFARLAEERVRAHPVRFYAALPLARLGDMWLRPRTELLPKMPLVWWDSRVRPRAALFGWIYGGLNLALLASAALGLVQWWKGGWAHAGALATAAVGVVLLRSGLLMTIDNSEPRYVLECYPVLLLLAAVAVGRWRQRYLQPASARRP